MADLALPRHLGHLHVVMAFGHLVHRAREREHGLGEAAREVEGEPAHDSDADEEGEGESREERHPRLAELRLRLGHDQVREGDTFLTAEANGVRDGEERAVLPGRLELERDDLVGAEIDADVLESQPRQPGVLARARIGGRPDDLEEPVAGGGLEPLGRKRGGGLVLVQRSNRRLGVELREPAGLLAELLERLVTRVVLEEAQRDQARD